MIPFHINLTEYRCECSSQVRSMKATLTRLNSKLPTFNLSDMNMSSANVLVNVRQLLIVVDCDRIP